MARLADAEKGPCHERRLRIAKFFVWAFRELTYGQEKESTPVRSGIDGGSALPGSRDDGELSPSAKILRDQLVTGEFMKLLSDLGEEIQAWAYQGDFPYRHPEE